MITAAVGKTKAAFKQQTHIRWATFGSARGANTLFPAENAFPQGDAISLNITILARHAYLTTGPSTIRTTSTHCDGRADRILYHPAHPIAVLRNNVDTGAINGNRIVATGLHGAPTMNSIRPIAIPLLLTLCLSLAAQSSWGQDEAGQTIIPGPSQGALERWQAMRFGMFIHWGPVSLKGTEIGWSRGREVPANEYDQLYREFNPTEFDADAWVTIAKKAGMKYLVLTAKHHDGFCLWDSENTDYDIMSTPYKQDILRALSDACRKQDIMFCTYHSICDWYHPDYPLGSPGGKTTKTAPNMDRYVGYLQRQVEETVRNYGPLGIMWFDGEWETPWTHDMGVAMYRHLRTMQPDMLINNRVDKGRRGMEGTTKSQTFLGDYDTPEQRVGGFNRTKPWESCITICKQWAWKPDDIMKSRQECLRTLIQVAGGDGNLLLNVGPMPDGRIEPRQVSRLEEIGEWLDQYGETIYGTRGGPIQPGPWGASTCQENKVYLFIMQWPADDQPVTLPALGVPIESSRLLSQGEVSCEQSPTSLQIRVPAANRDAVATIVEITLGSPAFDIKPIAVAADPQS